MTKIPESLSKKTQTKYNVVRVKTRLSNDWRFAKDEDNFGLICCFILLATPQKNPKNPKTLP